MHKELVRKNNSSKQNQSKPRLLIAYVKRSTADAELLTAKQLPKSQSAVWLLAAGNVADGYKVSFSLLWPNGCKFYCVYKWQGL